MFSRRNWFMLALLIAFQPVQAGINNPGTGGGGSSGAGNGAQINIGSGDILAANFINVFKSAVVNFNTLSDVSKVDDDGYLTSSPSGNVGISFGLNGSIWSNTTYRLRVDPNLVFTGLSMNFASTSCSSTGGVSFTGCAGTGIVVSSTSAGGTLTFTISAAITDFSMFFSAGGTYSHTLGSTLALYRLSDEADYLAGEIFTPEYKTVLKGLNPKTIRPMGWVQSGAANFNGETTWNYRNKPTTFTWASNRYPPGALTGTITGTDQYTSPAATDTPLTGWVGGEVLVGNVSNASTALITVSGAANNGSGLCRLTVSTTAALATNQQVWISGITDNSTGGIMSACSNAIFTITVISPGVIDLQGTTFSGTYRANTGAVGVQTLTVTGKTGGAKFIGTNQGFPLGANFGANITTGIGTFVYDSILDKVLYNPGGIVASIPIEAQVQLANRINSNLWATIPPWATDNYVTNWATTACSNLNSSLYLYPEYSNEVWNFGFPQSQWASERGLVFGWITSANQAVYGWYSLRVRQIMGNLIPASGCSGHKLRRVMAYQAGSDAANQSNRFEGSQLCPIASGGSCAGNAAYNTFTGTASYNTAPNRPIDVVEVLSYAGYADDENLCTVTCTPTAANAPFYQSLVTAWETPNAAAAISLVDNDVRVGTTLSQTVTASGTTFTTPVAHGFVANSTDIMFTVSGGTLYSGLVVNAIYRVTSTPLTTTFTIQPYVGGFPSGANVNAGTAGSGTATVGSVIQNTMASIASKILQFGETNATRYDATRGSLAPLRVEQYEASFLPQGPSAAQCTSLGITGTNCSASIAAAILAWKNDPKAAATKTAHFNQFMGTDATMPSTFGLMPHSRTPSQLVLPNQCGGGGVFSMLSDCLPNSTPFQMYNGFAAFSGVP